MHAQGIQAPKWKQNATHHDWALATLAFLAPEAVRAIGSLATLAFLQWARASFRLQPSRNLTWSSRNGHPMSSSFARPIDFRLLETGRAAHRLVAAKRGDAEEVQRAARPHDCSALATVTSARSPRLNQASKWLRDRGERKAKLTEEHRLRFRSGASC